MFPVVNVESRRRVSAGTYQGPCTALVSGIPSGRWRDPCPATAAGRLTPPSCLTARGKGSPRRTSCSGRQAGKPVPVGDRLPLRDAKVHGVQLQFAQGFGNGLEAQGGWRGDRSRLEVGGHINGHVLDIEQSVRGVIVCASRDRRGSQAQRVGPLKLMRIQPDPAGQEEQCGHQVPRGRCWWGAWS